MTLLLKLFIAHLLGDFLLQPASWVKEKESKKLASPKLYLHAGIHSLLTMLLVGDLHFWKTALFIGGLHLIIDAAKLLIQKEDTKRWCFFIDQCLHLTVIAVVAYSYQSQGFSLASLFTEDHLLLAAALLFLTVPSSVLIQMMIAKWSPHTEEDESDSLQNAGKYIGILERLFVFGFIVSNHWEAVGFFIAAKSVFRFGDLKESKDRKLTEYVLIGTLVSFGVAIITGTLYLKSF